MQSAASEITRKADSNLAIALRVLPKSRRADMTVFYAFCRVVDDIADDLKTSAHAKVKDLLEWDDGIREASFEKSSLGGELLEVAARHGVPHQWFHEIIEGCRMDIHGQRFGSWEELQKYNWKVAGAVGLVSTRIFGCVHADSERYAEKLGDALQLTNIIRDVGEDLRNGNRIYLPENDIIRFQYSERDLVGRVYDGRFIALMSYQAERAEHLFREAEQFLPRADRAALLPARMMAAVYQKLLKKMRKGRFHVFEQRYSLTKMEKLLILVKFLMAARFRNE